VFTTAATGPYPEPDVSSSHSLTLFIFRSILILSSHLRLDLPSGLRTYDTSVINLTYTQQQQQQ
jgi:hypothetical protein